MFEKTIKLAGKNFTIPMPNTGQILEIETMKSAFSLGTYGELMKMRTKHANFALDIIDSMAYFTVLSPEIRKQIKTDDWQKLDVVFANRLAAAFKIWFHWYEDTMKKIRDEIEESNKSLMEKKEEESDVEAKQ